METERQDAAAVRDLQPEAEAGLEPAVEAGVEAAAVLWLEAEPWEPFVLEAVAVQRDVAGMQAGQVRQPG